MTVDLFHDQSPRKYGTGPGSNSQPLDAVRHASVARHVTDCATRLGNLKMSSAANYRWRFMG